MTTSTTSSIDIAVDSAVDSAVLDSIPAMNTPVVVPFSQANRARVSSLYRRSLKLARDWLVQRDSWRRESINIRQRFESNRQVQNPRLLNDIFDRTEKELLNYRHPDPYIGQYHYHVQEPWKNANLEDSPTRTWWIQIRAKHTARHGTRRGSLTRALALPTTQNPLYTYIHALLFYFSHRPWAPFSTGARASGGGTRRRRTCP